MRWIIVFSVIASAVSSIAPVASADEVQNGAYFEFLGSGVVPTINYERRLTGQWFGRVGASVVTGESESDTDTTFVVPITISSVRSPQSNHHLELGGGIVIAFGESQDLFGDAFDDDDESLSNLAVSGLAGYRYQKPDGGFQFRAVITPLYLDGEILPWAGVSFGYAW